MEKDKDLYETPKRNMPKYRWKGKREYFKRKGVSPLEIKEERSKKK